MPGLQLILCAQPTVSPKVYRFDETDQHLSIFSETRPNSGETGQSADAQ
ncbi:hypothetical protein SAMN02787144_102823 [Streptomyces atratus]|uniref:Uncharacterized protein n=1 Tax=Streptomyces atratus TaxID=1893 RepID=A0A1K2F373_STRAR|nr:hypothetical protein SAMN02787144_102823 [Streptomyces atratus]